ncbi:hypothetical protein B0A49_12546 [Cryomyces minteri]|uniref:Uncharacterized protein n=1 Tax=Cryomyces minteri TaxID=331657 RepID=A0A4U0VP80_9PEZI|nr:hypothetical protein B0A49_12546 [Cryomyces minteri]
MSSKERVLGSLANVAHLSEDEWTILRWGEIVRMTLDQRLTVGVGLSKSQHELWEKVSRAAYEKGVFSGLYYNRENIIVPRVTNDVVSSLLHHITRRTWVSVCNSKVEVDWVHEGIATWKMMFYYPDSKRLPLRIPEAILYQSRTDSPGATAKEEHTELHLSQGGKVPANPRLAKTKAWEARAAVPPSATLDAETIPARPEKAQDSSVDTRRHESPDANTSATEELTAQNLAVFDLVVINAPDTARAPTSSSADHLSATSAHVNSLIRTFTIVDLASAGSSGSVSSHSSDVSSRWELVHVPSGAATVPNVGEVGDEHEE